MKFTSEAAALAEVGGFRLRCESLMSTDVLAVGVFCSLRVERFAAPPADKD